MGQLAIELGAQTAQFAGFAQFVGVDHFVEGAGEDVVAGPARGVGEFVVGAPRMLGGARLLGSRGAELVVL